LIHPRSSPVIQAIAREMLHIAQSETPDGAPAVPYLVFLVRPDGVRPYYEARSRLEPLGIAFGYELIEQDLAVDIPNFDDLTTWAGSVPLESPARPAAPVDDLAGNDSTRSMPGNDSAEGVSGSRGSAATVAVGPLNRGGTPRGRPGAGATDDTAPEDF